ncbi:hypothetical protein CRG98_029271 [Punica granatum]|uniref:Uncharacterized protein n=1 Tax=Punica granatum TaxID=22663 RepID=A0A2I0J274_PUNGR|nr:hypothetical protein CRG98_029271 [Punica granatum]
MHRTSSTCHFLFRLRRVVPSRSKGSPRPSYPPVKRWSRSEGSPPVHNLLFVHFFFIEFPCSLPVVCLSFSDLLRLCTFKACREHLDPSIGSSRNSISLGAVAGASMPSSIFPGCHGRYLSGAHHSPRLAGSPDPLATSPTLFLVHRG